VSLFEGIDLAGLAHDADKLDLPPVVQGRVVHLDADFLAYQVSAEKADGTDVKTFEDMKHNAEVAVETFKTLAGATGIHLHLTPSTSDKGGRPGLALLKQYQANRIDKPKPRLLNHVREWMAQRFTATLHQFCEADDGMSSMQYEAIKAGRQDLSIIASKDKDLLMVPGLHLDWDRGNIVDAGEFGELYMRSTASGTKSIKGFGQKFFWAQMLTGDAADNISGLPKVCGAVMDKIKPVKAKGKRAAGACGPATALPILDLCSDHQGCFTAVKALYKAYGEEFGFTNWRDGTPVTWQQAFISEAKLLWMRRSPHDPDDVTKWWQEIIK